MSYQDYLGPPPPKNETFPPCWPPAWATRKVARIKPVRRPDINFGEDIQPIEYGRVTRVTHEVIQIDLFDSMDRFVAVAYLHYERRGYAWRDEDYTEYVPFVRRTAWERILDDEVE